ncbi:MAG: O-antigen ligase domain-containing protein [Tannerella sp.]|jgi:hypothetical protein|nr:O-antigen ligase domain-containing protein [Tannerella sp.]
MQTFLTKQFFNLTVFTLIFGVIFYDTITVLGFMYIDEICVVLLLALYCYKVFKTKTWEFDRFFLIVIAVFLFYLLYSFIIKSNTKAAIITDFIIQFKPYLAFFCAYALKPEFTDNQKLILKQVAVICSLYVLAVALGMYVSSELIEYTFVHVSRLATASSVCALLYLYCSNYSATDRFFTVVILAIGLFSTRSKHYGFFAIGIAMLVYFNNSFRMKLNFKNVSFTLAALGLGIMASWNKIYYYFVTGGFGDGRKASDLYARMALFFFSTKILSDYIPFGSGFGSYATFASQQYYSPIYAKYGMDKMHGLSKDFNSFIVDTYYPALAQFGYVGVALFFGFFIYLAVKSLKAFNYNCRKESVIMLMIIIFFLIESTSDSTITHNRGIFMMMLMGWTLSEIKQKAERSKLLKQDEDTVSQ